MAQATRSEPQPILQQQYLHLYKGITWMRGVDIYSTLVMVKGGLEKIGRI